MTRKDTKPDEPKTFESLAKLLRGALGDTVISPSATTLLDMMTDDIVFEFPFPMPGGVRRIEGKTALETYLPKVGAVLNIETLTLERAIISEHGTEVAIEFGCKGCNKTTGVRYDQDYVSVLNLRDRLISRYRDYWNPLTALAALEGSELANSAPVLQSDG